MWKHREKQLLSVIVVSASEPVVTCWRRRKRLWIELNLSGNKGLNGMHSLK